jgi:hypothetical protein
MLPRKAGISPRDEQASLAWLEGDLDVLLLHALLGLG